MKKMILSLIVALATVSFSANAFAAGAPDCPLKNLKKNQLRSPDGTAYYPPSMKLNKGDLDPSKVNRNN